MHLLDNSIMADVTCWQALVVTEVTISVPITAIKEIVQICPLTRYTPPSHYLVPLRKRITPPSVSKYRSVKLKVHKINMAWIVMVPEHLSTMIPQCFTLWNSYSSTTQWAADVCK